MTNQTIILGNEYDDKLRNALRATLIEFGGKITNNLWVPDFEQLKVNIEGKDIIVEAETYIGLSVSGESSLVQRIATRVKERMGTAPATDSGQKGKQKE